MKGLVLFILILTGTSGVWAEDPAADTRPLSQLSFDEEEREMTAPLNVPAASIDLEQLLHDTPPPVAEAPVVPAATLPEGRGSLQVFPTSEAFAAPVPVPPSAAPVRSPGELVKFEWSAAAEPLYLPPRLKGPLVDEKDARAITTDISWPKPQAGCAEPSSGDALCKKALALKELLFRFSGSDDFYTSLCTQTCPDPAHVLALTSFAITDPRGGAFKILTEGKSCRYQVLAPADGQNGGASLWQSFEAQRGVCACLPASCKDVIPK